MFTNRKNKSRERSISTGYELTRRLASVLLIFLLLSLTAVSARAASDQETIALNFLKFLRSDKAILAEEIIDQNLLDPALPPVTVAHLFQLAGGGYLIVSTDRSISPVKAYSLTSNFADLPAAYRQALLSELELRRRVAAAGTGRQSLDAGPTATEAQWDFLLNLDTLRLPLGVYQPGTHLLTTRWNQDYPYNKFLPAVSGQTVLAGCVNVAVGQVMRYHRYPAVGSGVISYSWKGPPLQTLKTILYRGYNWDNMPATLDAATPAYQADEVALLLKDLGIAHQTDFDFTGSSTYMQPNVLVENFGYSTALAKADNTDYAGFLATLQAEIAAERPVLLTFPGHMTVADGFLADPTGTKIHVNMGWGGSVDDFYFLNAPVPKGSTAYFDTSAGSLHIFYNIKPCSGSDCAINSEPEDGMDGLVIAGKFDRRWDADQYPVYLKGPTTVSATRGYGNVAFYVSFLSMEDGRTVFALADYPDPRANTVYSAGDLPAGKYIVRASPCRDNGQSCFIVDGNYNYTVTLTTSSLSAAEKAAIDQVLERAPVIGNAFPDLVLNASAPAYQILVDARDENGDAVTLSVENGNPAVVSAVLNGNILELAPTGMAKVASRIVVTASANGQSTSKDFMVLTDNGNTAFGTSFTVGGTFASQEDVQTHRVILDGACTIVGDRGYSNTSGFYTSVLGISGSVIVPANDKPINSTFPPQVYQLRASLMQNPGGGGYYYEYRSGDHDRYTLTVNCPNADTSTATIAGLLGINLTPPFPPGDINGDHFVDLGDAILALQLLNRHDLTGQTIRSGADVDGDGKIGLAEVLFILQTTAGLRTP